ncbi:MAG TPA: penicillin-binding protein [Bacteroidales bacterium]|nr:MAG: hypothetical protein A2W98_04345 [Bacteroidetes bacterium GWF2_33_38]OFY75464.1 MAG: hypothetical protein A2265_10440 [Bacteroidetes bacterium RIFOXYA12_FULL_33_9]OFY88405.1 MAG: hypothetical protein A2236_06185 [Bacteroidetes bacterium RIFOXYA2_FULL_33_7]HBF88982.1 penicillin-binding protein [Bacteroidales bacterium]
MIKNTFISILFLLLASTSHGQSDTTYNNLTNADSILSKDQVNLIYQKLKYYPNKTQASLAIIKNGEVFFYGVEKLNDTLMSIENSRKAFGIGSITKVFTATLLANFVLDGKIKLDEKINPYLKFKLNNNIEISFLQLANHTSGLSKEPSDIGKYLLMDFSNPFKHYGEKELERYLKKRMTLSYQQNSKSEYSNLGFGLLAYTLSSWTGKEYEYLLDSLIFSRYNMTRSSSNTQDISEYIVPRYNNGIAMPNYEDGALKGAGSIFSTIEDMSKFALAQFDPENKELALTRVMTNKNGCWDGYEMALGWQIRKDDNGDLHYHGGGIWGYCAFLILDINKKDGIIILSNVSAYDPNVNQFFYLGIELMKTLN